MKIGIDVSQLAYDNTGVSKYLSDLVRSLVKRDKINEYILFFSSLRRNLPKEFESEVEVYNVRIKKFKFPPAVLDLLWNKLHILSIESLIGQVDLFITSDWSEPPARNAKKATIIYDLIVFKHPQETDQKIISVQKRKLEWVKKESNIVFCISKSSRNDAIEILGLDPEKVRVIHPGLSTV